ncbi:hypothetical protein [Lacunimicrobium album]
MSNRNFSSHQQKIIKRYYDSRDQLDEQKLAELVTNIFLATGKKLENHWKTAGDVMTRMGVPQSRIDNVMNKKDPKVLAMLVEDIQKKTVKLTPPKKEDKPVAGE